VKDMIVVEKFALVSNDFPFDGDCQPRQLIKSF
jgi:hypothetical protein